MADFAAAFSDYIDRCVLKSVNKLCKSKQVNGYLPAGGSLLQTKNNTNIDESMDKLEKDFGNIEKTLIKFDTFIDAIKNDIQYIYDSALERRNKELLKSRELKSIPNAVHIPNGNPCHVIDGDGNASDRPFRKKMQFARKSVSRFNGTSLLKRIPSVSSSSSSCSGSETSTHVQDSNISLLHTLSRKPNILEQSQPFTPHICDEDCAPFTFRPQATIFRDDVPYAIPIILGWKREVVTAHCRYDGNRSVAVKQIFYVAPCGRRLRNIEELDQYLSITKCSLSIDYFTYEVYVELYNESSNSQIRCRWVNKDITMGRETKVISAINTCDDIKFPPDFNYIPSRYEGRTVYIPRDPSFLVRCDCTDDCRNKSTCACHQLTIEATQSLPGQRKNSTAGYSYQRLKKFIVTGIYECNPYCSCSDTCHNKVVQNGIKVRLQIFKTVRRGWGVRCLHDIPAGAFVCTYSGEVMTEHAANHYASVYGDEYLADLDFIDVCEAAKEGYESAPIEELSSDEEADDADDADYNEEQESDDSFSSIKAKSNRRKTKNSARPIIKKLNTINQSSPENVQQSNTKVNYSGVRSGIMSNYRTMNAMKMSDGAIQFKSIRAMHGEDFSYTLDAKRGGNIGRFLNHSCSPNCFPQNVFVDTHDLRFPWVAFFANEFIPAFSEITWDYNYEIGSVEGKMIRCFCNSTECRYRLL